MKLNRLINTEYVKHCGYPDKAPDWIDGVYYPRTLVTDGEKPGNNYIEEGDGYTVFHSKAWKETEKTGYGVYFYEDAADVICTLANTDYEVKAVLVNPTQEEYKAHIRVNDILKAPEVTVLPGEEKEVSFNACIFTSEARISLLPAFVSELGEEVTAGDIYLKELSFSECEKRLPGEKPTVYLLSDSTVQPQRPYPLTGWGQELHLFFREEKEDEDRHCCDRLIDTPNVMVNNHAIGGRSSKSFIEEGRLDAALLTVRPGDFMLIQWGHNDATAIRPNRYVAPRDFEKYLQMYVDAARQRGAVPVLVTPVARRNFDEPGGFKISFAEYRDVMLKMSREQNIALLDLGRESAAVVEQFGPEGSKDIFMWLKPGEYPDGQYADGCSDNTHLQVYGAMLFANVVAKLIADYNQDAQLDTLKKYIIPRKHIERPKRDGAWHSADASVIAGFTMQELTIDGGRADFLLNWNRVERAESYLVYRKAKGDSGFKVVKEISQREKDTATTMPFSAEAGKIYEYYVAAVAKDRSELAESRIIEVNAL